MSETTTNGQPIRLYPSKGGHLVSLDELVASLSASGSSQDPAEFIQADPKLRNYLESHHGDPVPRNHAFRRGRRVYLWALLVWVAFWVAFAWWLLESAG